jgi:antitoxin component of RelBE/YafQ-DinJ toxin-antitoxin module
MKESDNYIGIQIDATTKRAFQKLCKEMGSNISVEIRLFILQQLNEAGK